MTRLIGSGPAGSAAGLADPTLVEGIANDLLSGSIAAETRSVIKHYADNIKHCITDENRYSKFLSKLVYGYPSVRTVLFELNGQGLSEAVTDIAMNKGKYSTALKNPINYFRLFKSLVINNKSKFGKHFSRV